MSNKIKIVCDTILDLPLEYKQNKNIEVVPLKALLDDVEYYDDLSMPYSEFYTLLNDSPNVAMTSQPNYGKFKEVFKSLLKEGYEILYIGGSSKSSGTFQSAHIASNELESDKIHIYDTFNISLGGGIQVIKALHLIEQGYTPKEVIAELEKDKENISVIFAVDTLDYLKKGGRISSTQATIGTMLNIKPLLTVKDGLPSIVAKCRGKKQVLNKMLDLVKDKYDANKPFNKVLIGSGVNKEDELLLKQKLSEIIDEKDIIIAPTGLTTVSHCGCSIFGLAFI